VGQVISVPAPWCTSGDRNRRCRRRCLQPDSRDARPERPSGWERWLQSLDAIGELDPKLIVCGHRKPESSDGEVSRMLDETRSYNRRFRARAQSLDNAEELINLMKSKYPDFGNPWTLQFSARSWFSRSRREAPRHASEKEKSMRQRKYGPKTHDPAAYLHSPDTGAHPGIVMCPGFGGSNTHRPVRSPLRRGGFCRAQFR